MGVTERPRSLNPSKAIAMAICPIIVHFSTWRARSTHDVVCGFARADVRSKDAQKQLTRTSLRKSKIGFYKIERIQKRIWGFFTKQIISRSFGSYCVKGSEEPTSRGL